MATYTENFGLHQWVPEDDFLRTDFNTDFQKIDAALGEALTDDDLTEVWTEIFSKCEFRFGSFVGNGASSRAIDVGDEPSIVVVTNTQSMETTMFTKSLSMGPLAVLSNGFQVGVGGQVPQNLTDTVYCWFCLC